MAQLATEQGCLLPRQYEQIAKRLHDCRNLCGAWINADRRRLEVGSPQGGARGGRSERAAQTDPVPEPPQPPQQLPLFGTTPG